MHERTRRNLCRLAFLALGVLPTVCTLAWASYRVSPIYAVVEKKAWEQRLTTLTGLITRVEQVEHPAGGSILLHHLELIDSDGNDRVAVIRQAEIAYFPEGVVVRLSQPEVASGKFLRLWDTLHSRVLQGPTPTTAVQISCGELTLEVGARAQTFTMVRCTVEPSPANIRASIDFQVAGVEMPTPARLVIDRNRQISPPMTTWLLQTATPLQCGLFADYSSALANLGANAAFQGSVSCQMLRNNTSAQLQGVFTQVDLGKLTEPLKHRLNGFATVSLQQAVIDRGVLSTLSGSVDCLGGNVSQSFVDALAQHVPLATPEVQLASRNELVRYDRLAFQFAVSDDGFVMSGLAPGSDVIMTARGTPLLTADSTMKYPIVRLVRSLAPDSQFLVPATDATNSLLQWFSFPPARPQTPNPIRVRVTERDQRAN